MPGVVHLPGVQMSPHRAWSLFEPQNGLIGQYWPWEDGARTSLLAHILHILGHVPGFLAFS